MQLIVLVTIEDTNKKKLINKQTEKKRKVT